MWFSAALLGLALGQGADDSLSEILGPQGAQELERLRYEDLVDTTQRPEEPFVETFPEPETVPQTLPAASPELCQDFYRLNHEVMKTSPALHYARHFDEWLQESSYQVTIGLGALLCGALCSWNGPKLWEVIVIFSVSLGFAWLVHFEAQQRSLVPGPVEQLLLVLLAGTTAALAVHSGFEGSQVLIGALLGFLAAVYCGVANWAQSADGMLPGLALSWYCAGGAFGVWIFTAWRRPLLATLAPLGGSYLVVTGLGFLLSRGLSVPLLPPQDAPWAAGAKVLLGPLGLRALPWHGLCALVAASLHNCKRLGLAVAVLVTYVVLVALGALVAGLECHRHGRRSDGTACPHALAVPGQWRWQLSGCCCWAALAAWCGFRQLAQLNMQKVGRYISMDDSLESPIPQPDPFTTRLPSGYTGYPPSYPAAPPPGRYAPGGLYNYVKSRH